MAEGRNHRRVVLSFSLYHRIRVQDYILLMSYNLFHLFWFPIDGVIWKRKDGSELNRDPVGNTRLASRAAQWCIVAAARGCSTVSQCLLC